jgi:hypothetical protein
VSNSLRQIVPQYIALNLSKFGINSDGSATFAVGQPAVGITVTGVQPTAANPSVSAGTFLNITAPNGGNGTGGSNGGTGGSITLTTGAAGTGGNANAGDYTVNLGLGTGTGRSGLFIAQTPGAAINIKTNIYNYGILVSSNAGGGVSDSLIHVSETFTDPPNLPFEQGIGSQIFLNLTADSNKTIYSIAGYVDTGTSAFNIVNSPFKKLTGIQGEAHVKTTGGTVGGVGVPGGGVAGGYFNGESDIGATSTIVNIWGAQCFVTINGATPTTNAYVVQGYVENTNTATVVTGVAIDGAAHINSGGGAITNAISVHAAKQTVGTNNIDFYAGSLASIPTGNFTMYTARTDTATSGTLTHFSLNQTLAPAAPSSVTQYALHVLHNIQGGANNLTGTLYGISVDPIVTNTATSTNIIAIQALPQNNSTGTISQFQALRGEVFNASTGTLTTTWGAFGRVQNSSTGTVSTAYGLRAGAHINSGGGTFTTAIGVQSDVQTVGTNNVAILIGAAVGGSFAFYSNSTLNSQFNGLLTTALGLTSTGATVNLNASSNFNTNINTGTSTGTVTIGNASSTAAVNINANLASTWTVASANLTISTTTSGTFAITSAGALNLTSGASSTWTHTSGLLQILGTSSSISLITDTSGAININAAQAVNINSAAAGGWASTSANLTISTVTSGTLALTSAGLLNLTGVGASVWTPGDGSTFVLGTTTGTKFGTVGGASGQKMAWWGAAPAVQPIFATGASHTVDEMITVFQTMGLLRQS